jgi:esterase/lipase superfamily enzyme
MVIMTHASEDRVIGGSSLHREYHKWYSHNLGREMELLVFGHAGYPILVFPTSMGRFYDWEDRGTVGAVAGKIAAGHISLYCVDSIDAESWYNRQAPPAQRVARHLAYERYLLEEVIPLMKGRGAERVGVAGASLGGFHAALLAFRHPWAIGKMVSMSGKFENTVFLNGHFDAETYFTNPLAFLPGLEEPRYLEPLRSMDIVLVTGAEDAHVHEDIKLSDILKSKGIRHRLDIWDGWAHDWPYWQDMARLYL